MPKVDPKTIDDDTDDDVIPPFTEDPSDYYLPWEWGDEDAFVADEGPLKVGFLDAVRLTGSTKK